MPDIASAISLRPLWTCVALKKELLLFSHPIVKSTFAGGLDQTWLSVPFVRPPFFLGSPTPTSELREMEKPEAVLPVVLAGASFVYGFSQRPSNELFMRKLQAVEGTRLERPNRSEANPRSWHQELGGKRFVCVCGCVLCVAPFKSKDPR